MSVFKNILVGSMVYGAVAVTGLINIGEPGIPAELHAQSGIYEMVVAANYNTLSAQNQLLQSSSLGLDT